MIYIASPYSHDSRTVEHDRFVEVARYASHLMAEGKSCISPVAYGYALTVHGTTPGDWNTWQSACERFLIICDRVNVLMLDGWNTSTGVLAEIALAKTDQLDISFIDPGTYAEVAVWPIPRAKQRPMLTDPTGTKYISDIARLFG